MPGLFDDILQNDAPGGARPGLFDDILTDAPPEKPPVLYGADLAKEALSNVIPSAGRLVGGLVDAVAHPVQTAETLWDLFKGAVQLIPGASQAKADPESQELAKRFGGLIKERYGGEENLRRTLASDPVGALADLSSVLSLGGGALKMAGQAAKVPGLAGAGRALGTAGRAVDPIGLAARGVSAVAAPTYNFAAGLPTGAGAETIKQAVRGSPEFLRNYAGTADPLDIVRETRGALGVMRAERGAAYRTELAAIQNVGQNLKFSDQFTKAAFAKKLDDFNIKTLPTGELDFSRSRLAGDPRAISDVERVNQILKSFGTQADDLTLAGMDTLKGQLDNFYHESSLSRAIVAETRNTVARTIENKLPQYGNLSATYAKTTELIETVETALSLKTRRAADTALRKLTTALRTDNPWRRDFIRQLEISGQTDISGAVAGQIMQPWMSQRLGSILTVGGFAALAYSHPGALALIPLASPKIVGGLSYALGKTAQGARLVAPPAVRQLLTQAGRVPARQAVYDDETGKAYVVGPDGEPHEVDPEGYDLAVPPR